ncbi:beta-lactamase family protein [Lactobacillus mulieris]|uniref:serine hydrolase domain-containing protein n=1 Tax=Lactobacillus mulieris TaxID=2508708 RepID=UPI00065E783F|nr:serine hydrolase domain-containing protein [Lactobacillus mulieris]MCF1783690.1 beta-lactamase family protein [Lactobacillus mulieris]MCW8104425.1 beta-lactamase family protein [Lactobacillus mulieris]MDK6803514.1 serine hydrolase domain-containing protein [Lactobacillus mulieris]MDK8382703.1 serine hydrolase domain-containing protein [Lactobacillus mulieris]MDT9620814.1 serine hydrolase domain-containing protein [Lactobacillus mulieris]
MRQSLSNIGFEGSVLVIKNGKTYLNYATVNKTDTSYLINSVQKFITGAAIMKAVQEGKLSLNDTLAKFYPTVPGANKVTILNLLQMASGLTIDKALGTKPFVSDKKNLEYAIKNTKFDEKMLGKTSYSTINYVFLSYILSDIYNMSYQKLITKSFINKLDLKHTAFSWTNNKTLQKINFVLGQQLSSNGKYITQKLDLDEIHGELGAGSLVMNNFDLLKCVKYILTGGYLSKNSIKILYGTKSLINTSYSGGFYIRNTYLASNGSADGYYSFLRTSNDAKTVIIVQTNRARGNFFELRSVMDKLIVALQK